MVSNEGIGAEMMCVMVDEVESLCLVKECRELKESYGMCFTNEISEDAEQVCVTPCGQWIGRRCWRGVGRNRH